MILREKNVVNDKKINIMVYTFGDAYEHILKDTKWNIEVMIVDNDGWKERVIKATNASKRIKNIISLTDFFNNKDLSYLTRGVVDKQAQSQLKFYHYLYRFTSDIQLISNTYYNVLAYSLKLFFEHKIDLYINMNFNHGNCDFILLNVAKMMNIKAYNIEPMLKGRMIVYDNNKDDLLQLAEQKDEDILSALFYNVDDSIVDGPVNNNNLVTFVKSTIGSLFYKIGGWIGEQFLACIYRRTFYIDTMFMKIHWLEYCKSYRMLMSAKRVLESMENEPCFDEKYIFFPLHFEPEATIDGRALIVSQLTIIQMISNVLPKGWKVYVKEHPHQFRVNTNLFYTFAYTAGKFKTKDFYRQLAKIDNVRVIKKEFDSKNLIKQAKAIATMSGTVTAEAMLLKKPVIVFTGHRTIYRKIHDYFCVESMESLKKAIYEIIKEKQYNYDDADDICKKFLLHRNNDGYRIAFKTIECDFKCLN